VSHSDSTFAGTYVHCDDRSTRELGSLCTQCHSDGPLTHLLFLASSLLHFASLLRFAPSLLRLASSLRLFASFTVSPRFVSSLVTVEMVNVVMSVEVTGRMNTVMMHGEVNDDTNTMMGIEGGWCGGTPPGNRVAQ
jgi:hypothetical protein